MPWEALPVAPSPQGWTVADIAALPDDDMMWELVDGLPRVLPRPNGHHQRVQRRLLDAVEMRAPAGVDVIHRMSAVLAQDQLAVTDLIAATGLDHDTALVPADQVLVVGEVVGHATRADDRYGKPAQYAEAGIPTYLRVELDPVHVIAYELGDDSHYVEVARAGPGQELRLTRPFPIAFDPAALFR